MRCYDCPEAHIDTNMTDGDELITIVCEHESFHTPMLLIHGFKDWLDLQPDNYAPKRCPLGGDK